MVERGKSYLVWKWNEAIHNTLPLTSLNVYLKYMGGIINQKFFYETDHVNITELRGYANYSICVLPIPIRGRLIGEEYCTFSVEAETLEAG